MDDDIHEEDDKPPQQQLTFPLPVYHTNLDLTKYPGRLPKETIPSTLVIGDLHGNPILLIHILIMYRVIKLQKDPYDDLYNLFAIDQLLSHDVYYQINRVIFILNLVMGVRKKKVQKIIFLGDMLADRGCNDYYMLVILHVLDRTIDYSITISNHDLEFIYQAENKFIPRGHNNKRFGFIMTDDDHYVNENFIGSYIHSLKTLMTLFYGGTEKWRTYLKEHTLQLYETVYKKHLKIAESCIHPTFPDKIILFYHAPIGLKTLEQLCLDLVVYSGLSDIEFKYETHYELSKTIDQMNLHFNNFIFNDNWFDDVFPPDIHEKNIVLFNPFGRLCWIRWDQEVLDNLNIVYDGMFSPTSDQKLNYDVIVIHGHDFNVSHKLSEHVFTLDHTLGQFMTCFKRDADQGNLPLFLM